MNEKLDALLDRMQQLEKQVMQELRKKEAEFLYEVRKGKIRFTAEAHARHKLLVKRLSRFLRDSRVMVFLTGPVIWACLIPVAILDLTLIIYQALCFPVYGIPKVKRRDYLLLDRHHLAYLNFAEKLNCEYCAYANGVLGFATEIAARTEQFWCPIKHALRMRSRHSRYHTFFEYGDAKQYRKQLETVRRGFEDIEAEEPSGKG